MTASPDLTPRQTLATMILGRPVLGWVHERRSADPKPTWQEIADELDHRTNGAVKVSREAIRLWFVQAKAEKAAA